MLDCVNCRKPVDSNAKLFAEVFVCDDCFRIAETLFRRGEQELRMLLVVQKEAIRISLMRGELQFSSIQQVEDVSKKDLVTHLADLAQKVKSHKEDKCSPSSPMKILSSETTTPSATTVEPAPR